LRGRIEAGAAIIADACAVIQKEFDRIAVAQQAFSALLPARLRGELTGAMGLMTVACLRQLVEQEFGRLGRGSQTPLTPRFTAPDEKRTDGSIPPLVETITRVTGVKSRIIAPEIQIAPAVLPAGVDAPALAEFQPSVGGGAASDEIREGGEGINHMPSSPTPAYAEQSESF
jgi:hypothetical protein